MVETEGTESSQAGDGMGEPEGGFEVGPDFQVSGGVEAEWPNLWSVGLPMEGTPSHPYGLRGLSQARRRPPSRTPVPSPFPK